MKSIVTFTSALKKLHLLPVIFGHCPPGSFSRTTAHYIQEINRGKFCQDDRDKEKNLAIINLLIPPEYNFNKINVSTLLYYRSNDIMTLLANMMNLCAHLHDKVKFTKGNYEKVNHLDFLWGRNADILLNEKVTHLLSMTNTATRGIHSPLKKVLVTEYNILLNKEHEKKVNEIPTAKVAEPEATKIKREPKIFNKEHEKKVNEIPTAKVAEPEATKIKRESKILTGSSRSLLDGIQAKLPKWQKTIVDKLVSLQQLLKKFSSRK